MDGVMVRIIKIPSLYPFQKGVQIFLFYTLIGINAETLNYVTANDNHRIFHNVLLAENIEIPVIPYFLQCGRAVFFALGKWLPKEFDF